MGFPVCIDNPKYTRNALLFNVVFAFQPTLSDPGNSSSSSSGGTSSNQTNYTFSPTNFEPIVRKIAFLLRSFENESEFLFRKESKAQIQSILEKVFNDLNSKGESVILIDPAKTMHLKLFPKFNDPAPVEIHQVPIRIRDIDSIVSDEWDVSLRQIIPLIDGSNFVKKIALETDIGIDLIKKALQHLLYYECIRMIDIFQYSNMYAVTESIYTVFHTEELQRMCINFVSKPGFPVPSFREVMALYCDMRPGVRLSQLFSSQNSSNINHKSFIAFGLLKGFIRRVHEYPLYIGPATSSFVPSSNNNLAHASTTQAATLDHSDLLDSASYMQDNKEKWKPLPKLVQ